MRPWIIEEYTEHSRKVKVTLGPKIDPTACLLLSATIHDNESPINPQAASSQMVQGLWWPTHVEREWRGLCGVDDRILFGLIVSKASLD